MGRWCYHTARRWFQTISALCIFFSALSISLKCLSTMCLYHSEELVQIVLLVIGQNFINCEKSSVINFHIIYCETPEIASQRVEQLPMIFFDGSQTIKRANFPNDLWMYDPSQIPHARWFTCTYRALRLYVGVENPSDALKAIVTFILKTYMPVLFEIQCSLIKYYQIIAI